MRYAFDKGRCVNALRAVVFLNRLFRRYAFLNRIVVLLDSQIRGRRGGLGFLGFVIVHTQVYAIRGATFGERVTEER